MNPYGGLNRRAFLRRAGLAAALGTVGGREALAAAVQEGRSATREPYDFDEIYPRFGTDSTKWDGAVDTFGEGIEVGMGIADMDFRAPPFVTRALAKRFQHENWGYLRMPPAFRGTIADWNRRRYGLEIDPATLTLTTGVHAALVAGFHAFAPPGSRVLMTSPVYNGFYGSLRFARVVPEDSPMRLADGRYSVDFDDFEERVQRCNVFLLCNPHNPTGNCWSREDLTRMGEICLRHRVIVFSDEIWCDLVMRGNRYTPFASLDRELADNSVTFKAASKTFNLPAMKVAWYFSTNPDLLQRIRSFTRADLNTFGIVANQAALTEGDDWLDQLLVYLDGNHELTERFIRNEIPLLGHRRGAATYLAWLDVSRVIERIGAQGRASPSEAAQRWFAENAHVFFTPGGGFGTGAALHLRMNLATPRPLLTKALENMAEALAAV
jgi:cystathionine beta-lyase